MNKILPLLLLIVFISSCKDKITDPIEENVEPGRRDYTWEVDTLNIPFTLLTRIWGNSPEDVWTIGPGGASSQTIYHFDGEKWSTDNIARNVQPISIYGFNNSDVWIGGREGKIWHFNGSQWSEFTKLHYSNATAVGFENMWGDSPNNIYAVGYADNGNLIRGIITNYDGSKWDSVKIPQVNGNFLKILRSANVSTDYFILGYEDSNVKEDLTKIFKFNGEDIIEIYSAIATSENLAEIELINNKIFLQKGRKIYKYQNSELILIHQVEGQAYTNGFFGRSSKDIFFSMQDGLVHLNGQDENYVFKFNSDQTYITGHIIFEKSLFLMAYDFDKSVNLIIRGYLH